jgi:hypothetical protein
MKTIIAILVAALCATAQAHELTFFGVTTHSASPRFPAGTAVTIRVHYNPVNFNIQTYDVSLGEIVQVRGVLGGGRVFVQFPFVNGSVVYQAGINSGLGWLSAEGGAVTPDGIAPTCIEDWGLNDFIINLPPIIPSTDGILTSVPIFL